jgi:hypothetical protein
VPAILKKISQKADKKFAGTFQTRGCKHSGPMKVETNFTLIKGQAESTNGTPSPRPARKDHTSGVVLLISQENQAARRWDPDSLPQARLLLEEVTRGLSRAPGEKLAEVHDLKPSCLIRLP